MDQFLPSYSKSDSALAPEGKGTLPHRCSNMGFLALRLPEQAAMVNNEVTPLAFLHANTGTKMPSAL